MCEPLPHSRQVVWAALLGGLYVLLAGCRTSSPSPPAPLAGSPGSLSAVFQAEKLRELDASIDQAIAEQRCPGGVLWLERSGQVYHRPYGSRALEPAKEEMTEDTIFDAASLTKVLATTPAILRLIERGQVGLDTPVRVYVPEFVGGGKDAITVRHLLTHTSGLRPDLDLEPAWSGYATGIQKACAEQVRTPVGQTFRYSDINFIVLGEVVRRVSGRSLDQFVADEFYRPLKMPDTGFLPPASKRARIAPTEVVNGKPWRGVVHDPTARAMGGVAGHAGLFLTAADLGRFARMMLNRGELDGVRVFQPQTVDLMTSVQTPVNLAARRGLGWDIDSPYAGQRGEVFPLGGYGHTGWTGTSVWIDPFSRTTLIFLSNRNHPTERGNVLALRHKLGTLAAQAVIGFNFAYVPGALAPKAEAPETPVRRPPPSKAGPVLNGIDVLVREQFAPLRGLRVGLITNHTGHDRNRRATIDLLHHAPGVSLKALFTPEHGLRGAQDEPIGDSIDNQTGLPVFSLYGETHQPKPEQLRGLDALVFDIQDVGCRFYTYTTTMGQCLRAAAQAHLKFIVLDRVDPIGGATVQGPVLEGAPSFVGFYPIPLRYGLTIGELAKMYNAEQGLNADLTVVPLEGWSRESWFDQTGQPWTNPSPNMRNLTEATLYPGIGLLESAIAVGRGTGTPFEVVGAPYVQDVDLAAALNQAGLAGVRFVPIQFTPTASTFKGQKCGGAYIVVTDRDRCDPVAVGLTLALTLQRLYPNQFALEKISHLLRHTPTLEAIRTNKSISEIQRLWNSDLAAYRQRRQQFLIYP